jgi:hypothetical protein
VLLHLRILGLQAFGRRLTATIDLRWLTHWRDHIDAAQIGGDSAPIWRRGHAAGGGCRAHVKSFGLSVDRHQGRVAQGCGRLCPLFRPAVLAGVGRGQHGLDDIAPPFLAISGTADTTAPTVTTQEGMN